MPSGGDGIVGLKGWRRRFAALANGLDTVGTDRQVRHMNDIQVVPTDPAGGHDSSSRGGRGFGDAAYVCVVGVLGLELGCTHPIGGHAGGGAEADCFFQKALAKYGVVQTCKGRGSAFADLFGVDSLEQYGVPAKQIKTVLDPPDGPAVDVRDLFKCHTFYGVRDTDDFCFFEGTEILALQVLRCADRPCGFIVAFVDLSGDVRKSGDAGRFAAIATRDRFVAVGNGTQDQGNDYTMLLNGCRKLLNSLRIPFETLLVRGAVMDLVQGHLADRG